MLMRLPYIWSAAVPVRQRTLWWLETMPWVGVLEKTKLDSGRKPGFGFFVVVGFENSCGLECWDEAVILERLCQSEPHLIAALLTARKSHLPGKRSLMHEPVSVVINPVNPAQRDNISRFITRTCHWALLFPGRNRIGIRLLRTLAPTRYEA